MATPATKHPTKLQLIRKQNKFICSWNIGDKNYKDGQEFRYMLVESKNLNGKFGVNDFGKSSWSSVRKPGVKATSTSVDIDLSKYYPNTGTYLKAFEFQVRGNRDKYKKKKKTIDPGWSSWETAYFDLEDSSGNVLPKPIMYAPELATSITCNFPWVMPNSVNDESIKYFYTNIVWQAALTKDGAAPTWGDSDVDFQTGKSGNFVYSGTISIKEDLDELFTGEYSYTRWVRVRAVGPTGSSIWSEPRKHVYTEPLQAYNVKADLTKINSGYKCVVQWISDTNKAKPINESQVEYCFTIPTADLTFPENAGVSWESAVDPQPDTKGPDAIQFELTDGPQEDEVMFVRVNNFYDNKINHGVPVLVSGSISKLKKPTLGSVIPNVETHMAQVSFTKNCEVPESFTAVYFRRGDESGDGQLVGILEYSGQSVVLPEWGNTGFTLGLKNYAGAEYEAIENDDTKTITETIGLDIPLDYVLDISDTIGNTPSSGTTITVAYGYERNRTISGKTRFFYFTSGIARETSDSDYDDDDNRRDLGVRYDGDSTFTFYIKQPRQSAFNVIITNITYKIGDSTITHPVITSRNPEVGFMESDYVWNEGDIPLPPSNVLMEQYKNSQSGSSNILVTWEWNWTGATTVELSWSDHEDAWESTDEPQTYTVENYKPNRWIIANLSAGKWWVRLRFIKATDEVTIYGTYTKALTTTGLEYINLSESPDTPTLLLQPEVITEDGYTTASWAYQSNDGTNQAFAEIWEATETETEGVWSYSPLNPEVNTQNTQHITISASTHGWHTGETHKLALKVRSASGEESKEFSVPVSVTIANKPVAEITDSSLVSTGSTYDTLITEYLDVVLESGSTSATIVLSNGVPKSGTDITMYYGYTRHFALYFTAGEAKTITEDDYDPRDDTANILVSYDGARTFNVSVIDPEISTFVDQIDYTVAGSETTTEYILTSLPLTATVSGAGEGGSSTLAIIRDGNSQTTRPDDSQLDGFDGEVIAVATNNTDGEYSFSRNDFTYLDESAHYILRASVTDSLNQSAVTNPDIHFHVEWDHQAVEPTAEIEVDRDNLAVFITPDISEDASIPSGWVIDPNDGFDIYRLSGDKPELIYAGAKQGETIVDPYPAYGSLGGHRIVFISKYGDYTTADNTLAIYDTDEDDGDILNVFNVTIDFGGERVILPYDISVSHKWSKDFTETKYLGGHVRGDWNPAVSKTTSINTTVIVEEDPEQVRLMRDLAMYPGLCHVRTPDGSSFTADVQVNEDREEKWVNRLAKFSISVTKVDGQGYDGMKYEDWI